MLRIFPLVGDENNKWLSPADIKHAQMESTQAFTGFSKEFFPIYTSTVMKAFQSNDWTLANELLIELKSHQSQHSTEVMPSERKINLELLLNKLNVFSRLGKLYTFVGLGLLIFFFYTVFSPKRSLHWLKVTLFSILFAGFLFHTFGLGLRWYISGHAPWSNGYESMIYISWTTLLAGLIFSRKSIGGLAATSVLSAIILMVASLSYMDPEITPLVPVLKSYWLTIHVSLEAGSYGFLMLGAIIGVLNLLLMIFANNTNITRVKTFIKELTFISEMTLIAGLFMISIGTYLGGVWANESWGRYWGWDPKETWALVTILVYAIILHMRFIPALRGPYLFNVATLFGFASVIMTYFGVNYYLSGLHSYAAGDPIPIPSWVYYTTVILVVLSVIAYFRQKRFKT
jgi:cytochrome c-type biogenesis protein CcsB